MSKLDRKTFAQVFSTTCLAYEKPFNKELAELFYSDLSGVDTDSVVSAFASHRRHTERGRFFPKVADIFYQIEGSEKQQSENIDNQAELQWSAILAASINGREPENLSIEARSCLRSIGGCHKVGYTLEKDLPFLKRDFIALFKSIAAATSDQIDDSIPLSLELKNKKMQVVAK